MTDRVAPRSRRSLISRVIDVVAQSLGHEVAFVLAVITVLAWLGGLPHFGIQDQNYQTTHGIG